MALKRFKPITEHKTPAQLDIRSFHLPQEQEVDPDFFDPEKEIDAATKQLIIEYCSVNFSHAFFIMYKICAMFPELKREIPTPEMERYLDDKLQNLEFESVANRMSLWLIYGIIFFPEKIAPYKMQLQAIVEQNEGLGNEIQELIIQQWLGIGSDNEHLRNVPDDFFVECSKQAQLLANLMVKIKILYPEQFQRPIIKHFLPGIILALRQEFSKLMTLPGKTKTDLHDIINTAFSLTTLTALRIELTAQGLEIIPPKKSLSADSAKQPETLRIDL